MRKCKEVKFVFYTSSVCNITLCVSCYRSNHVITAVVFGRYLRNVSHLPFQHPEIHNTVQISNIGRNFRAVRMGLLVDEVTLKSSLSSMSIFIYLCIIPLLMRLHLSSEDGAVSPSETAVKKTVIPANKIKTHYVTEWTFLLCLTFMETCIARCVFYITNEMQLIQYS